MKSIVAHFAALVLSLATFSALFGCQSRQAERVNADRTKEDLLSPVVANISGNNSHNHVRKVCIDGVTYLTYRNTIEMHRAWNTNPQLCAIQDGKFVAMPQR